VLNHRRVSDEYLDEDQFTLAFRARLVETREELGLTQPEMAKLLRCSPSMYPKYETRSPFPLYLLPRLINETDKPYSYWVLGIRPPEGSRDKARGRFKVIK
jgi:transcriptional regulator with XRE-family HTH domain